jgi:putative SOS response-associated peptidase YedK
MHAWTDMLDQWPEVERGYNIAPSMSVAAFVGNHEKLASHDDKNQTLLTKAQAQNLGHLPTLRGKAMRWGMVPTWSKEFTTKYATFNARLETVAEKATFRSAWKQRQRCLIPMAGYYEWQAADPQSSKTPFYITDLNVGGLLVAGLYESWQDVGEQFWSCTMITRPADVGLDRIHGRMPVLLKAEDTQAWLTQPLESTQEFLSDVASPEVVYWPVSSAVGNVRNNDERLCQAID